MNKATPTTASLKTSDGVSIAYRARMEGRDKPVLALVHSLAMDHRFWNPVADLLAGQASVVSIDARGHGQSERGDSAFSAELMARDLLEVLDHLSVDKVVVGGASMGGCVALQFAGSHAERTAGLALIDTTAWYGEKAPAEWEDRAQKAVTQGLASLVGFQQTRWFSDGFRARSPEVVQECIDIFLANDLDAYVASCRMLGAFDGRALLSGIRVPTCVVVGDEDYAAPVAMAQAMHSGIAGSTLQVIAGARHLTPLEDPETIAQALRVLTSGGPPMTPFEYLLPYSLDEAISLLDPEDPGIRPVGGGTAVMLMMKAGVLRPTRLVSLQKIGAEHAAIEVNAAGELMLGGQAKLAEIECHPRVRAAWPLLSQALRGVANARVRAVATIGGNLSHADPHLDMPPVLAALEARVLVAGPRGTREVRAEDLCVGYYETVLQRDELITQIIVPPQKGPGMYLKMTTRAVHDWPALGLAVVLKSDGGNVQHASIFTGAATDRPLRLASAQSVLIQQGLGEAGLRATADAAVAEAGLMGDAHGSAAYKSQLLRVGLPRAIQAALRREETHA